MIASIFDPSSGNVDKEKFPKKSMSIDVHKSKLSHFLKISRKKPIRHYTYTNFIDTVDSLIESWTLFGI